MRKFKTMRWLAVLSLALLSTQIFAHHSFSAFDRTKRLTVEGTAKELQWANPHVWLQLNVPDMDGKQVEYSFEGFGVTMLKRVGWNRESVKPGDKITVTYAPMRDGTNGGQLLLITFADGHVLKSYDR